MSPGRYGALALLLAAASVRVSGQDSLPDWRLGVSSLAAGIREVRLYPALAQVPILVLEGVRDLDLRYPPDEETSRVRETARLQELYAAGAESARLRDRRDAAVLSPFEPSRRAAEERRLRDELKPGDPPGRKDGSEILGLVTRRIVLWEGHGSGKLVEAPGDPGGACVREKLDYLILWEVGELSGYLRIRMSGWNAALGRPDFSHTVYCPADDIASAVEELSQGLIRAAAGRPSSLLVFDVEPPEVRILVEGRLLAPGRRSLRVYEEREYRITLELGTEVFEESTLKSEFGKEVRLSARAERPESAVVPVETDPPGASLYLDGIWAGKTPTEARIFGSSRVARLQLPGFEDEYAVIEPGFYGSLALSLRPAETDSVSRFDRSKERFYQALGRLAVSLPATLLAYALYLQSSALNAEHPGDEAFSRRRDVTLAMFAVSSGITAGFLTGASVRLAAYIKSAR
mgnify:CR=1 FL=1